MGWLSSVARTVFWPFNPGRVGPSYAMSASPVRLRTNATTLVTFTGISTAWLSRAPSLSLSSAHGATVGPVSVASNTRFTVSVTTGGQADTLVWTEATYGIQAIQEVRGGRAFIGVLSSGRLGR